MAYDKKKTGALAKETLFFYLTSLFNIERHLLTILLRRSVELVATSFTVWHNKLCLPSLSLLHYEHILIMTMIVVKV